MVAEKGMRLLYLYQELAEGHGIQKQEAAIRFGVNERSIRNAKKFLEDKGLDPAA